MTIGIVRPNLVPVVDLLNGTVVFGLLSALLVLVDLGVVAGLDAVLDDDIGQRQVVPRRAAADGGPLRAAAGSGSRRWCDDWSSATAPTPTTSWPASPRRSSSPTRAPSSSRPSRTPWPRRSASPTSASRSTGPAASGSSRPTAAAPAEVRTLPITLPRRRRSAGWCCRCAGCAAGCRRRDEQLLGDLVRQAATAARTSQLADELQDNRERLVVAREEERRRIRRDLHDGLGPALSGVVFQLESARLLVAKDPDAARARDRRDAATTSRTSSPTCDASCTTCGRRRSTTSAWSARCASRPSGSALPARRPRSRRAISASCRRRSRWRRTGSSARRSPTSSGTRLRRPASGPAGGATTAQLLVEVADDGVGIPPDVQAGVGLVSLRERAAELGGRTEVSCPATGGTVVRAWLPLSRAPDASIEGTEES